MHADQQSSNTCYQSADRLDIEAVVVVMESVPDVADECCIQVVDPSHEEQSDHICNKRLYRGEPSETRRLGKFFSKLPNICQFPDYHDTHVIQLTLVLRGTCSVHSRPFRIAKN